MEFEKLIDQTKSSRAGSTTLMVSSSSICRPIQAKVSDGRAQTSTTSLRDVT